MRPCILSQLQLFNKNGVLLIKATVAVSEQKQTAVMVATYSNCDKRKVYQNKIAAAVCT